MSNKGRDKGVVVSDVKPEFSGCTDRPEERGCDYRCESAAGENIAELRKILDSKPAVLALNIQRGDSSIYLLMQ